jgi:hydrogenase maturation protein HypF
MAQEFRFYGIVQGVGFRPWIYSLAAQLKLTGWVLNDGQGVLAHLEGKPEELDRFSRLLDADRPPLARIDRIERTSVKDEGFTAFSITESKENSVLTSIPADAATCSNCLRELFDPRNKRYRYPFINCTHCGPRYTITRRLPYDRPQTSMAVFPMCPECQKEYSDPLDRRFHAQPTCCPSCGPRLLMLGPDGKIFNTDDPIREAYRRIKNGEILAVKGIGGFHLVCDAENKEAVKQLRLRKRRPSKPFAVMCANAASARRFLKIGANEEKLLSSPQAPIVLCEQTENARTALEGIAPGLDRIGIMFPYTPIHWLLFFEDCGRSAETLLTGKPVSLSLVMTSANASGEPLVIDNDDALKQLKGIADMYLTHNRDILIRCDDSLLIPGRAPVFIRRARGFTPGSIEMPFSGPSLLATGAWFKNTACLTKGNKAYLTQHIGDLDRASNCETLQRAIKFLEEMLEIRPEGIVCDKHPDFFSSRLAEKLAAEYDVPLYTVQHHHAHIASVMGSNGLSEPIIGIAIDGVGLGDDGTSWGGEILLVSAGGAERLAHLKPLDMPGGDKCARQGWRMGLAALCGTPDFEKFFETLPCKEKTFVAKLLQEAPRRAQTSSLGRIFDAAASLLGLIHVSSYEGEAAMRMEALARSARGINRPELIEAGGRTLDCRPLLHYLFSQGRNHPAQAAADFHTTLAHALFQKARQEAEKHGITGLCIAGGCANNTLLMQDFRRLSLESGLKLYEAGDIPPNDGGIAFGQMWAVQMKLHSEK